MIEQKSAEQIAAEQKLEAEKQQAIAQALAEKKEQAGPVHFVAEGKVYKPVLKKVIVPGLGERTALEICVDEEAQAYLLVHGEGVIEEVK